jgi:hypothetical protein
MFYKKQIVRLVSSRAFWLWILAIVAVFFLAGLSGFIVIDALYHGTHMDTYAANGTFQLYNPMRRLAEGQIIGHDFPFFHGVGVPLLHYPLFILLGQNVFAAETAKIFVSSFLFLASTAVFFYVFFRNVKKMLAATALFAVISIFYIDIIYPGNSLVGLRSTFPIFVAAALLWKTKRTFQIWKYSIASNELLAVVLIALAVVCGTEQGVAAIIAYLAMKTVVYIRHTTVKWRVVLNLTIEATLIALLIFIMLSIITLGHAGDALRYAFIDIPADQGWYFGTPPNNYLTWNTLVPQLLDPQLRAISLVIILGFITAGLAIYKKVASSTERRVYSFLLTYGIIVFAAGITGYFAPASQLIPLERVAGLILVAVVFQLLWSERLWNRGGKKHKKPVLDYTRVAATGLLCILTVLIGINGYYRWIGLNDFPIKDVLVTANVARQSDDYYAASPAWKARLNSFKSFINPGSSLWSTYTGLYDSQNGMLSSASGGEDYIIHALGDDRRKAYEQDFIKQRPEYVTTLKPTYFIYEEWLWSRHWSFYNQLLTNYEIKTENDSHILWKLDRHPQPQVATFQTLTPQDDTYKLPANNTDSVAIFEVRIRYKAGSIIPLKAANRLPRYLIEFHDMSALRYPVSLPGQQTEWTFPVILMPGESHASFTKKADWLLPIGSLTIENVQFKSVDVSRKNSYLFFNNSCYISSSTRCEYEL